MTKRTNQRRWLWWGICLFLVLLIGSVWMSFGMRWWLLMRGVHVRFPHVSHLSTSQLADWLQDPEREPPLLLDVREKEEFAVSHLPGARWLSPHAKESELKALAALGRPLVLYCSVGIRSSKMVVRLQSYIGEGQVAFNLDGSLFRWANEKRMLHDVAGKKVAVVHPYDALWGRFLAGHVTSSTLTIGKR